MLARLAILAVPALRQSGHACEPRRRFPRPERRLLTVKDDLILRNGSKIVCAKWGSDTYCGGSGEEAVDTAAATGGFDAMVSDYGSAPA